MGFPPEVHGTRTSGRVVGVEPHILGGEAAAEELVGVHLRRRALGGAERDHDVDMRAIECGAHVMLVGAYRFAVGEDQDPAHAQLEIIGAE